MACDPLLNQARRLWEALSSSPGSFGAGNAPPVFVSPASQLCPPSWVGIVVLGGAAIITAPTEPAAEALRPALIQVPFAALTDPETLRAALPVTGVLGPATLGYVSSRDFRPAPAGEQVEQLAPGHRDVLRLTRSATPEDAAECGLDQLTSPAFVVRAGGRVAAVAGYQVWPASTAHLCVLTDSRERGRGLARQAASAAVAHALGDGLLPQWRARPLHSRRVAHALGFRELGSQLSIRLRLGQQSEA